MDLLDSARDSGPNSGMQNQRALYSSSQQDTEHVNSKVPSPQNGVNLQLHSLDLKQDS